VDRERWTRELATKVSRPKSIGLLLMGAHKAVCYSQQINNRDQLMGLVEAACNMVRNDNNVLPRVYQSLIRRCQAWIRARGGHFEHLF
ncbi:hypothetical protein J6590_091685, partial [Homalodisca vitripennis]